MRDEHQMTNLAAIRQFVFAGNSTFTLKSVRSGCHVTYRVEKSKRRGYFLSILTGSSQYTYAGFIPEETHAIFKGKKGMTPQAPSVLGFKWLLSVLSSQMEIMPLCAEFYHTGLCGRCGKELTRPDSIQIGLGPICRTRG